MKGKISIGRGLHIDSPIHITIENDGIFVSVAIGLQDFARCITGVSSMPCSIVAVDGADGMSILPEAKQKGE